MKVKVHHLVFLGSSLTSFFSNAAIGDTGERVALAAATAVLSSLGAKYAFQAASRGTHLFDTLRSYNKLKQDSSNPYMGAVLKKTTICALVMAGAAWLAHIGADKTFKVLLHPQPGVVEKAPLP